MLETKSYGQRFKILLKMSVHIDIDRACSFKNEPKKHTPLYKNDNKNRIVHWRLLKQVLFYPLINALDTYLDV